VINNDTGQAQFVEKGRANNSMQVGEISGLIIYGTLIGITSKYSLY